MNEVPQMHRPLGLETGGSAPGVRHVPLCQSPAHNSQSSWACCSGWSHARLICPTPSRRPRWPPPHAAPHTWSYSAHDASPTQTSRRGTLPRSTSVAYGSSSWLSWGEKWHKYLKTKQTSWSVMLDSVVFYPELSSSSPQGCPPHPLVLVWTTLSASPPAGRCAAVQRYGTSPLVWCSTR